MQTFLHSLGLDHLYELFDREQVTLLRTDGDVIKDEEGQKSLATSLQPKQVK